MRRGIGLLIFALAGIWTQMDGHRKEHLMAVPPRIPYLEKVTQRGGISIWIVDGTYVRTHIDEEFTNYGQHQTFTHVPRRGSGSTGKERPTS